MNIKDRVIPELLAFKYAIELLNKNTVLKDKVSSLKSQKNIELKIKDVNKGFYEVEKIELELESKKIPEKKLKEKPAIQYDKLSEDDIISEKVLELKNIDYYNGLDLERLYLEVKQFMIDNGVKKAPVSKSLMDKTFGAMNMLKLVRKWKVIPRKDGYIMGM